MIFAIDNGKLLQWRDKSLKGIEKSFPVLSLENYLFFDSACMRVWSGGKWDIGPQN